MARGNGRPWFLEINAHDYPEILGQFVDCGLEESRIFARSLGVMDVARPDHNQLILNGYESVYGRTTAAFLVLLA